MPAERSLPRLALSQSSLAAFDRCPRLFHLRYVRRLAWPAPLTGRDREWEEASRRGQLFHLLAQQHAEGVEVEGAVASLGDAVLAGWWKNYCERRPFAAVEGSCLSEVEMAVSLGRHVLVAKFDRLVLQPDGGVLILDWKTGSRPPDAGRLRRSWQTVAYCYVAVEALPAEPEDVALSYWHAGYPEAEVRIPYARGEHRAAGEQLAGAVARLEALGADEAMYRRTEELAECGRCPYRSYCERGRHPDPTAAWEDDLEESTWEGLPAE